MCVKSKSHARLENANFYVTKDKQNKLYKIFLKILFLPKLKSALFIFI